MGMMINRRRVCGGGEKLPYFVDMGLPSGTLWATRNIDVTQPDGFAKSPFQHECSFFSWGNVDGHNPISISAFDYDWGNSNDGPYAQTPGSTLTTDIPINDTYDAARANCGAPWQMPSYNDMVELLSNIDYVQADGETVIDASINDKRVKVNNVTGIYLKSKINGNLLFISASGYCTNGRSWNNHTYGYYWLRDMYSQTDGRRLMYYAAAVLPQFHTPKFTGMPIRPIIKQ